MKKAYAPIVDVMKTSCSAVCVFGSATYEVRNKPVYRTSISKDKLQKLEETHPDLYSEYTETTGEPAIFGETEGESLMKPMKAYICSPYPRRPRKGSV